MISADQEIEGSLGDDSSANEIVGGEGSAKRGEYEVRER